MLKRVLKQFFQDNNKIALTAFAVFFFFTLAIRFFWIDRFPVGINHDEADLVLSAQTIWKFGKDVSGIAFPKSLFFTYTEAGQAGLPSFLLSPFLGNITFSLAAVRVVTVVVSVITIMSLAGLVWAITKDKTLTIVTLLISFINPWLFFLSRVPTEAPFALMFVLVGAYLLFRYKDKRIFFSLLPFIFAFYSYYGAKPTVPLLTVGLLFVHYYRFGKEIRLSTYIYYLLIFLAFIGLYFLIVLGNSDSTFKKRQGELIFNNTSRISQLVDEERRESISGPLKNIFSNKLTFVSREFLTKYVGWTSPQYLFFIGDFSGANRFAKHGVFYIIDALFLVLGIVALARYSDLVNKKLFVWVIITFILIAPIGASLSFGGESYIYRGNLLIPPLIILISLGVVYLVRLISSSHRKYAVLLLAFFYLVSFSGFLVFYFTKFPVQQQENFYLSERVLSSYLDRIKEDVEEIVIIGKSPLQLSQQFLLHSNYFVRNGTLFDYDQVYYSFNGIHFIRKCTDLGEDKVIIVQRGVECSNLSGDFLVIQNQKDAGTIFKIYNDQLCDNKMIDNYRRSHEIGDYSIESMDDKVFCNRWIAKEL